MGSMKRNLNELLLDLHLDRVSDEDRAWLEAELARDDAVREKSDRMGRLLQPLDHWNVAPAPGNLTDKVLMRIQEESVASNRGSELHLASGAEGGPGFFPFPRMRNVIAAAACVLLMVGVFVPGISELRYRSRRAACANNLGSIYRGLSTYRESYAGVVPFAGGADGNSWLPGCSKETPFASNSRHPYLLVKLELGPEMKHFVCPSDAHGAVMDSAGASRRGDFALAKNVSYDARNLSGGSPILRPVKTTAYIGDRNPLFVNAKFNESVDPTTTNSPAHRRRGQTILMLDGTAEFHNAPVYGPDGDNPWMIGQLTRYTGTESQMRADDAFLVPGLPVSDPDVINKMAR